MVGAGLLRGWGRAFGALPQARSSGARAALAANFNGFLGMLGRERRFYGYGPAGGDSRSEIARNSGPVGSSRPCWRIEHCTACHVGHTVDDRAYAQLVSRHVCSGLGPTRYRGAAGCWLRSGSGFMIRIISAAVGDGEMQPGRWGGRTTQ